jgi:hypothetical protein
MWSITCSVTGDQICVSCESFLAHALRERSITVRAASQLAASDHVNASRPSALLQAMERSKLATVEIWILNGRPGFER